METHECNILTFNQKSGQMFCWENGTLHQAPKVSDAQIEDVSGDISYHPEKGTTIHLDEPIEIEIDRMSHYVSSQ